LSWYLPHQVLGLLHGIFFMAEYTRDLTAFVVSHAVRTGLFALGVLIFSGSAGEPFPLIEALMFGKGGSPYDWFAGRGPCCTLIRPRRKCVSTRRRVDGVCV
jgi:hypothetical protein